MKKNLLGGRTGLSVSELALGTGRFGMGQDGKFDQEAAQAVLADFLEAGGNFIDTSSVYIRGRAEEVIGSIVSGPLRDDVVIASKFGRTARTEPGAAAMGSHRKALQAEIEGSLRRLKTDHVDIYFAHYDDGVTPVEEIMRGLDDLVRAGKILHAGLSNFSMWRTASAAMMADLRGWSPLAVLQLHYNLLERAIDREFLPFTRAQRIGLMAWSPLAGGLLGGRKSFDQVAHPMSSEGMVEKDEQAHAIVNEVIAIAEEIDVAPTSVAVAWVSAQGVVPVIGPRDRSQLTSNLAAVELRLSPEQLKRLNMASERKRGYPYEMNDATWAESGLIGAGAGGIL